jgi:hypothetical protein
LQNAFNEPPRTSSNELPPGVLLSMTWRRRDSADLLAIRRQNSAG